MNQRWAWIWNEYLAPPLTDTGVSVWADGRYREVYERAHYSYGLLLGRVFIGVTVSRAL